MPSSHGPFPPELRAWSPALNRWPPNSKRLSPSAPWRLSWEPAERRSVEWPAPLLHPRVPSLGTTQKGSRVVNPRPFPQVERCAHSRRSPAIVQPCGKTVGKPSAQSRLRTRPMTSCGTGLTHERHLHLLPSGRPSPVIATTQTCKLRCVKPIRVRPHHRGRRHELAGAPIRRACGATRRSGPSRAGRQIIQTTGEGVREGRSCVSRADGRSLR